MDTLTHKRAFSVLRMILILVLIDQKSFCRKMEATLYCVHIVFIPCLDELEKKKINLVCLIPQPFEV